MGHVSRRKFLITGTAAGAALATMGMSKTAFAQDDNKPTIRIGSKNFTESIVLGEIIALLMEDAAYPVERSLNLGGTVIAHESLTNGDIDVYVEYTGTGLMAILGLDIPEVEGESTSGTPQASESITEQVYEIVAEEYPAQFGVEWLEPWGFNNTNAIIITRQKAEELGVTKVSDLAPYAGDMTLGSDQEFRVRPDGLPDFEKTYGFSFGDVVSGDIGLMYPALAEGEVDIIQGYSTDGRIPALDFILLEDDMRFFPPYYAAPVVRQETLEQASDMADILNQLAGKIDDETIAQVNYRVDGDGLEPIEAASEFLVDQGLISPGSE